MVLYNIKLVYRYQGYPNLIEEISHKTEDFTNNAHINRTRSLEGHKYFSLII